MPGASPASRGLPRAISPQRRPSTMIGAPMADRMLPLRAVAVTALESSAAYRSIRAGRPVSNTSVVTFWPPRGMRVPRPCGSPVRLHEPTATVPSWSYRATDVDSAGKRRPTSSATAANTAAGGVPRATSVATRRRAACSSATRRSSTRACALAIAVATSSVNPASRCSVPAGSPSSWTDPTVITPHSRPPTLIGAPAEERAPDPRATAVAAAASSARRSTRAGALRSNTRVATLRPPRPTRCPTQAASPTLRQPPTNSIASPEL